VNRKLYILFAALALALLMTVSLILFKEMNPQWKRYQEAFFKKEREKTAEALAHADKAQRLKLEKQLRYLQRPHYEIRQILVNGGRRVDRCITCHLDQKALEEKHQAVKQFPFEEFGCTVCHGGVGRAVDLARAHSTLRIPRRPLFEYLHAFKAGNFPLDLFRYQTDGKPIDFTGSELCLRCHLSSEPRHVARWRTLKFKPFVRITDKLKTLREKGLTLESSQCYACHTTGYNERTGRFVEDRVACESCHGPGGFYTELMTGGRAREGAEVARKLVLGTRAELVCLNCHKPDRHLAYEGQDGPPFLVAAYLKGKSAPKLDGSLSEDVWSLAPETSVATWKSEGGAFQAGTVVLVRALYSDTEIYFSLRWPDKTPQRTMGRWLFRDGRWQAEVSWPDGLALDWQATAKVADFGQGGCAVLCHTTGRFKAFPRMATREQGALVDEWIWNAYLAASAGRPGDGFLDDRVEFIPPGTQIPAFRWAPPTLSVAHGSDTSGQRISKALGGVPLILNAEETEGKPPVPRFYLQAGQRLPLPPGGGKELKEKFIPLYLPGPPETGDSADIRGKASWADGYWTLELGRSLQTSHERDVQFDPAAKEYSFGLAVWDGTIGDQHQMATIVKLRFEPQPRAHSAARQGASSRRLN